jgi:hypothetical protein
VHASVGSETSGRSGQHMIEVRTLMASDTFPEGFSTGYERMPVMKSWVWVAEEDGDTAGVLMAAPMHGLVYMMRLCIRPGAPRATAVRLLRTCMRDCEKRGFKGYWMHVDPTGEEVNRKMIPIVRRAGGVQLHVPQVLLAGSISAAARF